MNKEQIDAYKDFSRKKLGFEFNNLDLLITALTHRSYVNEHKKSVTEHNERLEFLGDAVLELVVSDFLFRNYNEAEGIIVRMSKGEKHGSTRAHQVILADCFEAVIGAIYLDQGYDRASEFIGKMILSKIDDILESESWRDPKSHLQELAQRVDGVTPVYKVLKEEGPEHDKKFTLGVFVAGKLKASGIGHSKQEAQTAAAATAIKSYKTPKNKK